MVNVTTPGTAPSTSSGSSDRASIASAPTEYTTTLPGAYRSSTTSLGRRRSLLHTRAGRDPAHPPRAWYQRLLPHFSSYTGPYPVGVYDFEWETALAPDSALRAQFGDALVTDVQSLLVRVFYPADPEVVAPELEAEVAAHGHHLPQGHEGTPYKRPKWLGNYEGVGYGDFIRMPKWISKATFGAMFCTARLPAYENAPVLAPGPVDAAHVLPHVHEPPPTAAPIPPVPAQFPVIIFSHGLGGTKGTYSYVCGELASRGAVVVAIEHRDGSASRSVERQQVEHAYQRIGVTGEENRALRINQVHHRVVEVRAALALVRQWARGESPANQLDDKMHPWRALAGRMDLGQMMMAGHSFGGGTSVAVLQQQRLDRESGVHHGDAQMDFKAGYVMDPWLFAVDKTKGVDVPLLSASTETFHWPHNVEAMHDIYALSKQYQSPQCPDPVVTTIGTAHQNHSDFVMLVGKGLLGKAKMAGPMDPVRALQLHTAMAASFMSRCGIPLAAPEYYGLLQDPHAVNPEHVGFAPDAVGDEDSADDLRQVVNDVLDKDQTHPDVVLGWAWYKEKFGTPSPFTES
ncbi:Platelet-activating factor acetylhydrolase [Allomyces javanicus]|nr:Platelet-activating factor acetylhydrolase [Allomyces javanicus]